MADPQWEENFYISGSFCVSNTAAIGIPKFDAGPQKSDSRSVPTMLLSSAFVEWTHALSKSNP